MTFVIEMLDLLFGAMLCDLVQHLVSTVVMRVGLVIAGLGTLVLVSWALLA